MKEFEAIYSEYYDVVFRYVRALCRDEQWAQEITQEAFFKALKNIDSFHGESKLNVWLCQIAKNTFYTDAKRRKRQPDDPLPEEPFEEKLYDKETSFQIHQLLHRLDEPYKEVFWMRIFGELSFKEIGLLFDKTETWARVTYHRAKTKIKERVK